MRVKAYDPLTRGPFCAGVRTMDVRDATRDRHFPCELWYPAASRHAEEDIDPAKQDVFTVPPSHRPRSQSAVRNAEVQPGTYPLIVFSHSSGGNRRQSTFVCTHLASHGYVVAAMNHSEIVAPELMPKSGETAEQKAARADAWIANRVPDVRFLIDYLLGHDELISGISIDSNRIGLVGHSFGGWTVLATPDVDKRICAVVALAPAGASQRKPGILPVTLKFNWSRDVPTLYLVAENDSALPLAGMHELFERTPATKRMIILQRTDHLHFMDNFEELHEAIRKMGYPGSDEMLPAAQLASAEPTFRLVRGLTACHMDAALKGRDDAWQLLASDFPGARNLSTIG